MEGQEAGGEEQEKEESWDEEWVEEKDREEAPLPPGENGVFQGEPAPLPPWPES